MTKHDKPTKQTRRDFFRTAGLGVGAAVASVAGGTGAAPSTTTVGATKDNQTPGYRLTEHVKRYYDLAK